MWFAGSQPGLSVGAGFKQRQGNCSAVSQPSCLPLRLVASGILAIAFAALSSFAQGVPVSHPIENPLQPSAAANNPPEGPGASLPGDFSGGNPWGPTSMPLTMAAIDTIWLLAAESCNSWTESSSHSPTVSVARLSVPGKASSEYQKGCGAFKDKKLNDAEEHERSAIRLYPNYAAAWVLLGQVLEAENKRDDGRTACSQARSVDPSYVAPYLCLADLAATEENWQEESMLSGSALTLDPAGNAYSFYYAADAAFHLGDMVKAEKDAQNSITLDKWRHFAQAHLLLAQIYKAKADFIGQAAQLREYLKIAPNSPDSAGVKNVLAQLQAKNSP
jgi:tetratricopeptide (TPR) repeat protein